jgi:hypothetical protein
MIKHPDSMKYLLTILLLVGIFGCQQSINKVRVTAAAAVEVDQTPGACPYLTKDNKGRPVLSWVRTNADSSHVFCYAVSTDDGQTFGQPIVIHGSTNIHPHSENLPKVIFKPSGEIIALWGAANPNPVNKHSGLVYYSQSFTDGRAWSDPKPLVADTASFDQRYYDVALLPGGEAAIIWLDNRKEKGKEGSSLYFATTRGKNGFVEPKRISESCCPCCRTDLYIDSKAGIHVLYRGIVQDSIRDMVHIVSTDNGNNFSVAKRISDDNWVINGCPHTGPAMTENNNGLHFAWFTGGKNKGCYYSQSPDNGANFQPRNLVSEAGSHPQIAAFKSGELLVAWDEGVQAGEKFNKRIGVQVRDAQGAPMATEFITADTSMCSYPVIGAIENKKSIVAYTTRRDEKTYIAYRLVEVNQELRD